jgi:TrmH family RNA methyltransferase
MRVESERVRRRRVESRQNARVKELRAAFADPADSGRVAVEGERLLEEALRSGLRVATVFVREGSERLLDGLKLEPECEVLELPAAVFESATATEHPQGIAALVELRAFGAENLLRGAAPLVLVMAGLQDPGNLGTLLRSAEAFGATGVIALPGTVSEWNGKALRASAGSAFRVPVVRMGERAALEWLRGGGIRLVATVPRGGVEPEVSDLSGPVALAIGNEGAGLSAALIAEADVQVSLPCAGPVESLNAAVAGSVLLYAASRQRTEAR